MNFTKFVEISKNIFNFFLSLFKNITNFKKNKVTKKKNEVILENEIKKIANNAESDDEITKQKAIDDMRKLISD